MLERHMSYVVISTFQFLIVVGSMTSSMTSAGEDLPCTEHHVIVPRDCQPGTLVMSLEYVGQTFQITADSPSTSLLAVTPSGDVICTVSTSGAPSIGTVSFTVECRLGLLAWTELIQVTVAGADDTVLTFGQPYYEGHVTENAPPNSVIDSLQNISVIVANFEGSLLATVGDSLAQLDNDVLDVNTTALMRIRYSLTSGPDHVFHLVDRGRGVVGLKTLVELDFERQSQYLLTVEATSPDLPSTASAKLRVYVININDNAPALDTTQYYFRVNAVTKPEDVTDMRVTAFDPDGDEIKYFMEDANSNFVIDSQTGYIYLRRACARRLYEFPVYADDGLHRSDPAVVRVEVVEGDEAAQSVGQLPTRGRRDVRPLRQVEVPENMIGDVLYGNHAQWSRKLLPV